MQYSKVSTLCIDTFEDHTCYSSLLRVWVFNLKMQTIHHSAWNGNDRSFYYDYELQILSIEFYLNIWSGQASWWADADECNILFSLLDIVLCHEGVELSVCPYTLLASRLHHILFYPVLFLLFLSRCFFEKSNIIL